MSWFKDTVGDYNGGVETSGEDGENPYFSTVFEEQFEKVYIDTPHVVEVPDGSTNKSSDVPQR